jgi:hypothetical protein
MNERIKELAEQAGMVVGSYANDGSEVWMEGLKTPGALEKFAELIVWECVVCAEREWIRNGDTEHNRAVTKVIESIKQHFGVEE